MVQCDYVEDEIQYLDNTMSLVRQYAVGYTNWVYDIRILTIALSSTATSLGTPHTALAVRDAAKPTSDFLF